jgi:hypothetical protein
MRYLCLIILLIALFGNYWFTYEDYHVGLFNHCNRKKCVAIHSKTFLVLDDTIKYRLFKVIQLLSLCILLLILYILFRNNVPLIGAISVGISALLVFYLGVYRYKYFAPIPSLGCSWYLAVLGVILLFCILVLKNTRGLSL